MRIAVAASKADAYLCQHMEICSQLNSMENMEQEDLDEFKSVLLAVKLDSRLVDKVMNDALQKFVGGHSMEEIFKAKVCINTPSINEKRDDCLYRN